MTHAWTKTCTTWPPGPMHTTYRHTYICIHTYRQTNRQSETCLLQHLVYILHTGKEDYEELYVEVPIRFGVSRKCVGISIIEDREAEEDESFQVLIEVV